MPIHSARELLILCLINIVVTLIMPKLLTEILRS